MVRRSASWNTGLAKDLQDQKFAQEFILDSLREGLSLQVVLAKVIAAYGIKEFSQKVKIPSPNLLRAVNPKHNPTIETLNRILRVFSLELTVAPARKRQAA